MPSRTYSLSLDGLSAPQGEIPLRDLVDIAAALQLTATRIARQISGQTGRGRSTGPVDRISELRLSGVSIGSTVLELSLGDDGSLGLAGGDEDLVAARFEESLTSIASNAPPDWASPGVTAAIGKLANKVTASGATRVEARRGSGSNAQPWQVIDVSSIDLDAWKVQEERNTERVAMAGVLDKVDLRARRFRVRDDVGNDVTLDDVVDVDAAAQLIGQRVVARGVAERDQGRVVRIIEPVLTREEIPEEWFASIPSRVPVGAQMSQSGITGVTADEVADFLAEIRG
jgi:hypothetical protein